MELRLALRHADALAQPARLDSTPLPDAAGSGYDALALRALEC